MSQRPAGRMKHAAQLLADPTHRSAGVGINGDQLPGEIGTCPQASASCELPAAAAAMPLDTVATTNHDAGLALLVDSADEASLAYASLDAAQIGRQARQFARGVSLDGGDGARRCAVRSSHRLQASAKLAAQLASITQASIVSSMPVRKIAALDIEVACSEADFDRPFARGVDRSLVTTISVVVLSSLRGPAALEGRVFCLRKPAGKAQARCLADDALRARLPAIVAWPAGFEIVACDEASISRQALTSRS